MLVEQTDFNMNLNLLDYYINIASLSMRKQTNSSLARCNIVSKLFLIDKTLILILRLSGFRTSCCHSKPVQEIIVFPYGGY